MSQCLTPLTCHLFPKAKQQMKNKKRGIKSIISIYFDSQVALYHEKQTKFTWISHIENIQIYYFILISYNANFYYFIVQNFTVKKLCRKGLGHCHGATQWVNGHRTIEKANSLENIKSFLSPLLFLGGRKPVILVADHKREGDKLI